MSSTVDWYPLRNVLHRISWIPQFKHSFNLKGNVFFLKGYAQNQCYSLLCVSLGIKCAYIWWILFIDLLIGIEIAIVIITRNPLRARLTGQFLFSIIFQTFFKFHFTISKKLKGRWKYPIIAGLFFFFLLERVRCLAF